MGPPSHPLRQTLSAQHDSVMHAGLPTRGLQLLYRQLFCNVKSET